ncbi:MAG: C40 family peptidase [Faecalibacterium prausnitzii]|nr:C40 family peptidase [Faecalibacterium prausnitzii]
MSEKQPKLRFEEEKERTATRSPPKKSKVEQSVPKKQKLKQDADKAAEKAQHLRFGKAEITPDEASRMTKQQKRAMYAAAAARSAVHREVDQYEDDNVGTQALSEGEKAAETTHDISKSRYARKLKKKAKMQGKDGSKTAKSSPQEPTATQDAGASCTGEGGSNWLSRWRQKQDIQKSYRAATRSGGTAAQTAGGQKAASGGVPAAKSGMEQVIDKGKSVVSTAFNGIANFAKSNAHVLLIVGVFLLLLLLVMSAFSSCSILFSGTTQVSGQTIYTAEDRDIQGAETDYKKLEKELDKKIKRTPTDHPGYNEYQYHLDPIEHDPWQLTSFLTTLYDDYTRSEVQGKLKETFKKQYKLTTWVEVQIRYKTVWVISPAGIPVPTQVPYEYRIFHTKLVNKGLEVVIREELDNDQWKRYEIFQDTLGGRPYLFNGGLPPGGSDGSGTPGIDYQVPAEALTDSEFAAIYKEAQKYVGTPYVWGGSTPETGFDCSGYVCWVYNQNGYNVGRTTANGLWNKSQHISEAEAKPGDLVFFEGTYDTPGKSHVGIYLGNGKMVSAGDPIKYADIHSSYWQKYLSGFGRLSK